MLNLHLSLAPTSLSFTDGAPSPKISPSDGSGSGSGSLTPAGAVVQTYKRGLDSSSPGASSLPSPSFQRKQASDSLFVASAKSSSPVTPYYTVFGSTSGRVVAVGGPEELRRRWLVHLCVGIPGVRWRAAAAECQAQGVQLRCGAYADAQG
ncbi:hypothetical protein C8R45DRAFT_416602 [Mycena sanguinolenta]|nr:hypothetical protein C8R45DRAFT_416602 [Mycena sanguinolenta]